MTAATGIRVLLATTHKDGPNVARALAEAPLGTYVLKAPDNTADDAELDRFELVVNLPTQRGRRTGRLQAFEPRRTPLAVADRYLWPCVPAAAARTRLLRRSCDLREQQSWYSTRTLPIAWTRDAWRFKSGSVFAEGDAVPTTALALTTCCDVFVTALLNAMGTAVQARSRQEPSEDAPAATRVAYSLTDSGLGQYRTRRAVDPAYLNAHGLPFKAQALTLPRQGISAEFRTVRSAPETSPGRAAPPETPKPPRLLPRVSQTSLV